MAIRTRGLGLTCAVLVLISSAATAGPMNVTVTIQNLAPANSISFAPLRLGFHNGTFDSFNNGQAASPAIISIAEGGSGNEWFPAFQAAEPQATLGSIDGALLPGQTATSTFRVDPAANQFFTFGTMVIPSNDFFLGNDSPTAYQLFDRNGNLQINHIGQSARDIWDAGSEEFDPANAAFLVDGNNDLRTPQNGVVSFNFNELSGFNGRTTRGGYIFNSQLNADSSIYRISFSATPAEVPEPATLTMLGMGLFAIAARRRWQKTTSAN